MTKEQYLQIRNDPEADSLPVIHFYYLSRGGTLKSLDVFNQAFSMWLLRNAYPVKFVLGKCVEMSYKGLDEYFNIEL